MDAYRIVVTPLSARMPEVSVWAQERPVVVVAITSVTRSTPASCTSRHLTWVTCYGAQQSVLCATPLGQVVLL